MYIVNAQRLDTTQRVFDYIKKQKGSILDIEKPLFDVRGELIESTMISTEKGYIIVKRMEE